MTTFIIACILWETFEHTRPLDVRCNEKSAAVCPTTFAVKLQALVPPVMLVPHQ